MRIPKKKAFRALLVVLATVFVAGGGLVVLRGSFRNGDETKAGLQYTPIEVTRGDILITIPATGTLEPNQTTTVRPNPNMPTRKIVRIMVEPGRSVVQGQALVEVDSSGLDLELASAQASYEAQSLKLYSLKNSPSREELAAAQVALLQVEASLKQAQEAYESTRKLVEKGLAPKDQLAEAERELNIAHAKYESQKLSYEDIADGASEEALLGQESAVAQASNNLRKAELVAASTTVVAPVDGMVTEVLVQTGELASANTALMTIADMDPMVLKAEVDEIDVGQVAPGQQAQVFVDSLSGALMDGTVSQVGVKAKTQSNVTVFVTSIEVPNTNGKLLWGMNGDAEIVVTEAKAVLLLPAAAVDTSAGVSRVQIQDEGQVFDWEIRTGANDGVNVQIVAELDEGDEVVIADRKSSNTVTSSGQQPSAMQMMRAFR